MVVEVALNCARERARLLTMARGGRPVPRCNFCASVLLQARVRRLRRAAPLGGALLREGTCLSWGPPTQPQPPPLPSLSRRLNTPSRATATATLCCAALEVEGAASGCWRLAPREEAPLSRGPAAPKGNHALPLPPAPPPPFLSAEHKDCARRVRHWAGQLLTWRVPQERDWRGERAPARSPHRLTSAHPQRYPSTTTHFSRICYDAARAAWAAPPAW